MSKKITIINLSIFFLYLISFTKPQEFEWIEFDFTADYTEKKVISAKNKTAYAVNFEQPTKIPFYIKVQVTSDDNNPAPRLCFSNSDPNCIERAQLVKNPNDKTIFFWVKREQFQGNNEELYILVECEGISCSYTIRVEGDQIATFSPNFSYSYLVTTYNREMNFDIQGIEKDAYMTVAIDGSSKAVLDVEPLDSIIQFKTGWVTTFHVGSNEINTSSLASITIRNTQVGEYITLSVHLIENTDTMYEGIAQNGLILPNGPEITGYLDDYQFRKECFPIDLSNTLYAKMKDLYITGRIHTKYALLYLEDENREEIDETNTVILDGQLGFVMGNKAKLGKLNYLCFELPKDPTYRQENMIFSFSISDPDSLSNLYSYYPPQLNGEIYRRIIPKGKIAFFSGTKNDITAQRYEYNLYQIKGVTKMYIEDCNEYPDCKKNEEDLDKFYEPKNTNQMYTWSTEEDKSSTIGNKKYVIVAQCLDDDNENGGYCEFETSFISKGQDITLIEDEKFSKFIEKEEKGSFIADLQNGRQIERLTFDIMIFSGDVSFTIRDSDSIEKLKSNEISYIKYYLSNKIFIHFNIGQKPIQKIIIDYIGELNSFFTIQYSLNSYNLEQFSEFVPSGESYLVQIDPTSSSKTKNIFLQNQFYKNQNQFLSNFFAINCEFEVKRSDTKINFFDGYAQEILNKTSSDYKNPNYKYTIKITEPDNSNYNHKMCMLYIAGYENETKYEREIIIAHNINQQIIFNNNFRTIRFLYPHSDINKDLSIHVNVVDKAFYKIFIFLNNKKMKESTMTRSDIIYIKNSALANVCNSFSVCPIVIQVEYKEEIIKTEPMIEITVREIKNTPSYIQKGQAKLDYVCGDNFYYLYTDIGKNELAEITINFLREFGSMWAKVVRKDLTIPEDGANWRWVYRMPSQEWGDSLPFNHYTKKLLVSSEDTANCIEGCYLLMSIQISQLGDYVPDDKFYPFSILTRIIPNDRAYTDIPKVVIQVDEFIIGNVDLAENDKIFEFFEVWFPHDSEIVLFDWQSSVAGLYINLGGTRPTTKNADFKLLPPGKDSILNLTKIDIINKAKSKKITIPNEDSLQDINLVLGIWADKTDSINTEIYSLRIHQPDSNIDDNLDIVQINTDQKILCNPILISEEQYRCLFVVIYDDEDVTMLTPLLAYGGSLNYGALNYIYANYINRNIYDEYLKQQLIRSIPTYETATFNTRKDGIDYIYTSFLEKGKYMFINIITDKPDPIMIVTSMPIYNHIQYEKQFYPNPTTEQLLSVSAEQLRIIFPCTNSVLVDIVTLNGHAEISWKNDPNTVFAMRGTGDRISLSSGNDLDELIIKRLDNDDNNIYKNDKLIMEDPKFLFVISYLIIDNSLKYNEINYGKSLEIAYKDVDLPVFLYSKIGSEYRDINIAITFRDNEIDQKGVHELSPLTVRAQLVRESIIYEAKRDPDLTPLDRGIEGCYDSALKTAQIFLSEEAIKSFNIKDSDNPTIFIRINKNGHFDDKTFEKFSIEAQVSGVNNGVIPVEKIYHYGRVRNEISKQTFYRLKTDKNRPIMRIQIAFNSDNLDFAISEKENQIKNTSFLHWEKDSGKSLITLATKENNELYYLYIFKKSNIKNEEYLNNYAFKYFNVKNESEILDYKILKSPDITYSENKEEGGNVTISCQFNKLDIEKGKANITYFFKVVENSTYYYGEECNTIAITQSPYYTTYERNPVDADGKITLTAKGNLSNWVILNVIAQVQENNVLEYISYNGKMIIRYSGDDNNSDITVFIIIGIVLFAILVALVIAIFIFSQRNKKLLSQIKNVSFQKTNNNVDPNSLLKKSSAS